LGINCRVLAREGKSEATIPKIGKDEAFTCV
jgi:hypothetical protein